MAWLGSRATATRIGSRLPTMALVGSNSTQPAPGRYTCAQACVEPPPTWDGPSREGGAERTHRLDHEKGKIAAAAAPEFQGQGRISRTLLRAALVGEALFEGVRERHQQRAGIGRAALAEELTHPAVD